LLQAHSRNSDDECMVKDDLWLYVSKTIGGDM
jgi:hypothetical protein